MKSSSIKRYSFRHNISDRDFVRIHFFYLFMIQHDVDIGRPKRRWLDSIRNDLSERELSREDTQYRTKWRRLIRHIDPT